jgi:hypothetical protein
MATLTGLHCPRDGAVLTQTDGTPLAITVAVRPDRPPKPVPHRVGQHVHIAPDPTDVAQCPTCGDRWRFTAGDDPVFVRIR